MRNPQIYEEACEWFVRMRDGDDAPGLRGELMEWLRRSPEHVSAYLDIAAVWMEAKNVEVDSNVDLATRIALAKGDKGVAELAPRESLPATRFLSGRGLFTLVASVLIVMAGLATAWWIFEGRTYSTGLGEQRSIALRDGSTLELNSQSRVRIHLDEKQRTIELLRGQALFHAAKDASRPFIVRADKTSVRAIGTVFDVYRKNTGTIVTVVEGQVSVDPHTQRPSSDAAREDAVDPKQTIARAQPLPRNQFPAEREGVVLLAAGQQVVVSDEAAAEPKPVNVTAVTAWTRRELVFEFTPLAEAAAEFNRYNERQLIVEGEALRAFKISAVFRSTDPGSLVRYLQNMQGVWIEEGEDTVVIRAESKQ